MSNQFLVLWFFENSFSHSSLEKISRDLYPIHSDSKKNTKRTLLLQFANYAACIDDEHMRNLISIKKPRTHFTSPVEACRKLA